MTFLLAPSSFILPLVLLNGVFDLGSANPSEPLCKCDENWPMPTSPGMFQTFVNHMDACSPEDGSETNNECCFVTPPLKRISAQKAFHAYQNQEIDGNIGVAMIDVRSPEELYWTGQPTQMNSFDMTNNENVIPDNYRTTLLPGVNAALAFDAEEQPIGAMSVESQSTGSSRRGLRHSRNIIESTRKLENQLI